MLIIRYQGDVLAPSSHCCVLIETPLGGDAGWEYFLSIASMGLTNSKLQRKKWKIYFKKLFKQERCTLTLSVMTFSITTLRTLTLSKMTFSTTIKMPYSA